MEVLFFIITIFFACFLRGVIGFGNALIATPLALIFLDKETVVSSMLITGIVLNGFLTKKIKGSVNYKTILILFLASLVGMPIGIWILKSISMNLMKVLVGALTIIFTIVLSSRKFILPKRSFSTIIAGFFTGILHTSTSMSGPPVVLLLTGKNIPKDEFRRTIAVLFLLVGIISTVLFVANHIITFQRASFGLISIPFVFLGGFFGDKVAGKIPQKVFRLLVLGIIFLSGFYSLLSGLNF